MSIKWLPSRDDVAKAARSMAVGGAATVVGLGGLWLLVDVFHFTPAQANVPTLLAGSLMQFIGNRQWAFAGTTGKLTLQMPIFFGLEFVAFLFNAGLFELQTRYLGWHYLVARVLATTLVFWAFSFPLWKWLFRPRVQVETEKGTDFLLKP